MNEYNLGKSTGFTERGQFIPTTAMGQMSQTSEAVRCFTQQEFSSKLQAYMINYVISVSGLYSVYA